MKKYILSVVIFSVILILLTPYFTTEFLDFRQKKEDEENHQRLLKVEEAIQKAKKYAEKKNYLLGKFDGAKRDDFVLIPAEYTLGGMKMYTRKETYQAFLEMQKAALLSGIDLRIVSATRNFDYQKDLWNNKWTGVTFVDGKDLSKSIENEQERFQKILEYSAAPGTSRHHWGTDLDINGVRPTYFDSVEGKKQYAWLVQNAPLFGFCQTYNIKGDNRLVGYNEEKWHWSYLPLSRTLTQEYKTLIKEEDVKGFLGDKYVPSFNLINNYVLSINPDCI